LVTVTPIKFPGRSKGGGQKPFITHSHKTQVFPTKQNTVKCFRTAKASELMVHWNKNRGSREENMILLNPWGRILSLLALCGTGLVCSQLGQNETRVIKGAKTMGLLLLLPVDVCLKRNKSGSRKLKLKFKI
jgi:hypothetical protein